MFYLKIFFVLFRNCHFQNVFLTFLPTLWNSALKMTTLFRNCWNLFISTLKYATLIQRCKFQRWNTQHYFNVDLTLSHVATSYQPKENNETTLKCFLGILKKEDSNDKTNYKLLSVLSLLSNCFKNVMYKQFYE